MIFKLDNATQEDALKLDNAHIGTHIYAPEKLMKGWVTIPFSHAKKWREFAEKAIQFVEDL